MNRYILIFLCLIMGACNWEEPVVIPKHIYYLHGRILEEQGKNAVSEEHGTYEIDSILQALTVQNAIMHFEVRPKDTDIKSYAVHISKEIDSLIASGVQDTNITVIGASKGAMIASEISTINNHPISYILMAGNNDQIEKQNNWELKGRILCIYDLSDTLAGKHYNYWKEKTKKAQKFVHVELNTGKGHGFLYKPMKEWVEPCKEWILYNTL